MAVVESEEPDALWKKRKRDCERPTAQRKLLVNDRVEVRSEDEGFLGSWHSGIVVACDSKRRRCVRYDHLLTDDESDKLVEAVAVSRVLDGVVLGDSKSLDCGRGNIRPLPPPVVVLQWGLHYGLCVDAHYNAAWWEGVIFDHDDGAAERMVFFPDLGDEMKLGICDLRISQDWDEATGSWRRRGNWMLLELIEEMCDVLPVSVKQIWYDVREKRGFEKVKEWTCRAQDLWKKMISEVISEYLKFLAKELYRRLELGESLLAETMEGVVDPCGVLTVDGTGNEDIVIDQVRNARDLDSVPPVDVDLAPEEEMGPQDQTLSSEIAKYNGIASESVDGCSGRTVDESFQPCVPTAGLSVAAPEPAMDQFPSFGYCDAPGFSISCTEEELRGVPQVLLTPQSNADEITSASSPLTHGCKAIILSKRSDNLIQRPTHQKLDVTVSWKPFSQEKLSGAESCPSAIAEYYVSFHGKNLGRKRSSIQRDVWKHLLYLGWKIDCSDHLKHRKRYTSPDGKSFYSLYLTCKYLSESSGDTLSSASVDDLRRSSDSSNVSLCLEQPEETRNPDCCPQTMMTLTSVGDTKPAYCLDPVMAYYQREKGIREEESRDLRSAAKELLTNAGWVIGLRTYENSGRKIWVCKSPTGKVHYSVRSACKDFLDREGTAGNEVVSASCSFQENSIQPDASSTVPQGEPFTESRKVKVRGLRKPRRKRQGNYLDFATAFQTQRNIQAIKDVLHNGSKPDRKSRQKKYQNPTLQKAKKSKTSRSFIKSRDGSDDTQTTCVLRSRKRVQEVVIPHSSHRNPRTTLSWLLDNNAVLPRAKVRYINRKSGCILAEGRITRKGIKCSCCGKLFSLHGFGVHAGSKCHRGGSDIFLEDGRSLADCQRLVISSSKMQGLIAESQNRAKSNWQHGDNDYICSVCHYGGELMLCDQCPSSFHKNCLGLKDIPEGNWFCPPCCCGVCGESNFKGDKKHTKDEGFRTCGQCERKYHVGCLRNKQSARMKSNADGNWFCNDMCKKIFFRLQKLLGNEITVGANNLTWSLLKPAKSNRCSTVPADVDAIENYSKLNVAISVMHECFEPVKDPCTRRDLVEDVIFGTGSELQRLNFQGFYTVVLARNDEFISVATVRVHGNKVAEVPLVGTRIQYRRLGMCRILMNELEKKLMEIGVERLVLPAVPSVLNTWTTSFGFSKMTASERLHFLNYTFLDFQDTVMCQKLLKKIPSAEFNPSKGARPVFCGDICERGEDVDIDESSAVSEVYQAEEIKDGQTSHLEISAGHNSDTSKISTDMVVMAKDSESPESRSCVGGTETNQEISMNVTNLKRPTGGNFFSKCYKRRKKLIGASLLVKVSSH